MVDGHFLGVKEECSHVVVRLILAEELLHSGVDVLVARHLQILALATDLMVRTPKEHTAY